jgi:hypothetical protein
VLDRPGDGWAALQALIDHSYETDTNKERHRARVDELFAALLDAGAVEQLDAPDDLGRTVRVTIDLQETFALNQPLAPFALAALDLLDPEHPDHALDVVSVVEAVLDDPRQILAAQRNKAKGEAVAAMKAAGHGLRGAHGRAGVGHVPPPLAELLEPMFEVYRQSHPWVAEHPLPPRAWCVTCGSWPWTSATTCATTSWPAARAPCCGTSPTPTGPSSARSPPSARPKSSTT